jgi:hypothetical protein
MMLSVEGTNVSHYSTDYFASGRAAFSTYISNRYHVFVGFVWQGRKRKRESNFADTGENEEHCKTADTESHRVHQADPTNKRRVRTTG